MHNNSNDNMADGLVNVGSPTNAAPLFEEGGLVITADTVRHTTERCCCCFPRTVVSERTDRITRTVHSLSALRWKVGVCCFLGGAACIVVAMLIGTHPAVRRYCSGSDCFEYRDGDDSATAIFGVVGGLLLLVAIIHPIVTRKHSSEYWAQHWPTPIYHAKASCGSSIQQGRAETALRLAQRGIRVDLDGRDPELEEPIPEAGEVELARFNNRLRGGGILVTNQRVITWYTGGWCTCACRNGKTVTIDKVEDVGRIVVGATGWFEKARLASLVTFLIGVAGIVLVAGGFLPDDEPIVYIVSCTLIAVAMVLLLRPFKCISVYNQTLPESQPASVKLALHMDGIHEIVDELSAALSQAKGETKKTQYQAIL